MPTSLNSESVMRSNHETNRIHGRIIGREAASRAATNRAYSFHLRGYRARALAELNKARAIAPRPSDHPKQLSAHRLRATAEPSERANEFGSAIARPASAGPSEGAGRLFYRLLAERLERATALG